MSLHRVTWSHKVYFYSNYTMSDAHSQEIEGMEVLSTVLGEY